MKAIAVIAILILFDAGTGVAQNHGNVSPSQIKSVKVRLVDDTEDACWTNLSESRDYAEEKLRMAGYTVAPPTEEAGWALVVWVNGFRENFESCIGSIEVTLAQAFHPAGGGIMVIQAAEHSKVVISNAGENLNEFAIETIQEMVNDM